jgi:hypothetical protein
MKCKGCGFELPEDWPVPAGGKVLCVPCERRIGGGGTDRGGAMTP